MNSFVLRIFIIFSLSPITSFSQEKEEKTVLILYSLGPSFPTTIQWDLGLRSGLGAQRDFEVNINTEYLDLSRYHDLEYIEKVKDLFQYKYGENMPDLIITVFEPALLFVLNHRDTLFPEVPIIFGAVEKNSVKNIDLAQNIRGVFPEHDAFKETLDLALQLHPDTRSAVIITGTGYLESSWLKSTQGIFQQYKNQLIPTYWQGLSVDELRNRVQKLPDNTLIFYYPVFEDQVGNKYDPTDVLSKISKVSPVPIYCFWEISIKYGAVGGHLIDFPMEAKKVAQLSINILSGASLERASPSQNEGIQYIFDDRQLKRWSIPDSKLPPGSEIRFHEYTFWEKYLYRVILIVGVLVFQSLIIAYLLLQRRKLRESQLELLETQQKYKTVADYTYDWEYWQNPDGSIQWISPSCRRICGYSRASIIENPSLIYKMIHEDDKKIWDSHKCSKSIKTGIETIQFRIQTAQKEMRWIEHTCQLVTDDQGNALGVRANNRDVTDKEMYKSQVNKLQSELIHMERRVTVSALTYAITHEINQPLTSIRSYAQAALRYMDKDGLEEGNIRKALHGIVADNKRASEIVNELRDLVKEDKTLPNSIDFNQLIKHVLDLLHSEIILRNATIHLELDQTIPKIVGHTIPLQQVLLNLLINGMDAMEEQNSIDRIVTISTRAENDEGIIVQIDDNGLGISEDKVEEIFEAFHTTKAKGMGLGLAISKLIIESHRGRLWAENNPKSGARFLISLPYALKD